VSEQTGSWQPDPFGRHQYRYWNGSEWTDQVANDGVTAVDPPVADLAPAVAPDPPVEPAPAEPDALAAPPEPTPEPVAEVPSEPAPTTPEPVVPAAPSEPQGWAAPDATTAMPASPPPPATGAPGGPGEPAPPADTGGGGGGSNLPGIIVGIVILAALLGAAAWFLFLRGDDDDARATVVSALREDLGLSSSQADCVADELDDRLDINRLAADIEADNEPTGAQMIALMQSFEACDVSTALLDFGDSAAGATTTTVDDDDDPSTPGMSIPAAMLDLIAQGIMEETGLTQQQARCFAEGIFTLDGLDFSSILSDPDAFGEDMMGDTGMTSAFFEVFDRCGIDPREFEGGGTGSGSDFQPGDTYGDNPILDRLWDQCEDGDGEACDELYFTSEVGSEYEEFGDTCGGRVPGGTVLCANEDLN
jgi:hypothetical protein